MICLPVLVLLSVVFLSCSPVFGIVPVMNNNDESTRETLKPWSERWKNKRIGFHLRDVNPALVKHSSVLLDETCEASSSSAQSATRIFVPLCGKAIDMAYLATSTSSSLSPTVKVVGLDGIRIALEQFVEEHPDLKISQEAIPPSEGLPFERFEGDGAVSLWKGDYFDLETSERALDSIGTFEAIYDRASIVAIEPKLRSGYVRILDRLLKPGGRILLVALERVASPATPSAATKGPPYSVPGDTVRELFAGVGNGDCPYTVELLQETDQLVEKPEDRKRYPDLDRLLETVYLIRKEAAKPQEDS